MKGSRIHLDLYRIFLDLAQTGSFTRTAERHHLTQSAVSQQVAFLERHFGCRLLDRERGTCRLTEAGHLLRQGAARILKTHEETEAALQNCQKGVSGIVRLETVYSIGLYGLPKLVKRFLKRYPQVDLQVEYHRSDHIVDHLREGLCDLGLVAFPDPLPGLEIFPFQTERMVLACPPGHPLAALKRVPASRLGDFPFLAFRREIPTRRAVDRALRDVGVSLRCVREFDNIETLKRAVEAGIGITLLPSLTVHAEQAAGTLEVRLLADLDLRRPTAFLRLHGITPRRAVQVFLDFLSLPAPDPPAACGARGGVDKARGVS